MLIFARRRWAKVWTAATIAACALLLFNNTIYLESGTPRFFLEKGAWAKAPWWLAAFYFHVAGASVCLGAGIPLMFPAWTMRHPRWHRWLGYLYLNAVLWIAAPTGLALAAVAKGGLWSTIGFALSAVLWQQSTWAGYWSLVQGDVAAHIRWMIRSYAWALSAPAFRLIQIALYFTGLDDETNYLLSLWLSMAASVWLAESYLYRAQAGAKGASPAPQPAGV